MAPRCCCSTDWRPTPASGTWLRPFSPAHARVVALDLRGHGGSAKPDVGYDFDTVARDVMRFCRVLGLRKPLIAGHSWGCNVALHCAANYPSEVSGLVMVDGGYIEPSLLPGWTWERARGGVGPARIWPSHPPANYGPHQTGQPGPLHDPRHREDSRRPTST